MERLPDEERHPLEYRRAEPPPEVRHSRMAVPLACISLVCGLLAAWGLISVLTQHHGANYFGIGSVLDVVVPAIPATGGLFFGIFGWTESLWNESEFARRLSTAAISLSGVVLAISLVLLLVALARWL
jgi:hypothetical protein